ncbi:hypothetical protein TNCV_2924751 [Trichonephila clavipes]|nr:hypothetical protein TNCV_2924751 [Trichonephila clavipes]
MWNERSDSAFAMYYGAVVCVRCCELNDFVLILEWANYFPLLHQHCYYPSETEISVRIIGADKPQTLDHLEDNIRRVIADIRPQMLEKVIENWTSRLDYIRASRGSPMPEIIFKM